MSLAWVIVRACLLPLECFYGRCLDDDGVTLATIAPSGMVHAYFLDSTWSGVTGNTIFPKLQTMGNRRRRAAQKRLAEARRLYGLPVGADKKFLSLYLGMTLITERILRMRGDGDELAEFLAIPSLLMAGETVGFIAAEG